MRPQARITYARVNSSGVEGSVGVFKPKTISACRTLASCAGTADEAKTTFALRQQPECRVCHGRRGRRFAERDRPASLTMRPAIVRRSMARFRVPRTRPCRYNAARQPRVALGPIPTGRGTALFPAI